MSEMGDSTLRARLAARFVRWSGAALLRRWILRRNPKALRQNLTAALDENSEDAAVLAASFTPKERKMLRNLLGFRDVRLSDVMVPRAEIFAVEEKTPLAELHARFIACAHSRLPIYRESLDHPVGMVHIKDVLKAMSGDDASAPTLAQNLQREVLFAPPSMPAMDLLLRMQASRVHLALVIDEYGGTDGLVSIENLVEEIVGEIEDEHDGEQDEQLLPAPDGSLQASARLPLKALEEHLALKLNGKNQDSDSVGGLVTALAGQVPQRGEVVLHPSGVEFEIADADARRIKRVRIRVGARAQPKRAPPKPPLKHI